MKTSRKVDAATNRERQKAFRDDARKSGMRKVSFYLSADERAILDQHCDGRPLSYAVMEAVYDSQALKKHVGMMERIL